MNTNDTATTAINIETEKSSSEEKDIRITFQFKPDVVTKLDRLAEPLGSRTRAAEYAFGVADEILNAKAQNQFIAILNPDGTVEGQIRGPNEIRVRRIPDRGVPKQEIE